MQPQPDRIPLKTFLYCAILSIGVVWMIYLGVNSPGTSLHDEITHYFIARDSWSNPVAILDVWGRPGNTLFYMLPSLISVGARRWWAVITCVIITLVVTRSAQRLGLRQLWLIPLALYLQPWFLQLGFNSITQIPFMLALTVGIDQWIAGRRGWASLMFGLLPIIRHEGMALTVAWIGYLGLAWLPFILIQASSTQLKLSRLIGLALIALFPMIAWNMLHYAALGRLASGNLLEIRPTAIYGSGDWLHFFFPMLGSVGTAVFALAMLGVGRFWREQRGALVFALPALFYYISHTLIYRFGLFASGGYVLFLLPMAPTFALLAAFAAERLPEWIDAVAGHRMDRSQRHRTKLIVIGMIFGAALLYNGAAALAVRPWQLQPNEIAAQEAADWLIANRFAETPVYSTHTWFFWVYEDLGNLIIAPGGSKLDPSEVPPGAFVLWDVNYGNLNGIELDNLSERESGFTEVQRFYQDQMILFRKDQGA